MSDALSPSQFNVERSIMEQGNPDEIMRRVQGIRTATANIFKPSFSDDYRTVRSTRSPASAEAMQEEEDEE